MVSRRHEVAELRDVPSRLGSRGVEEESERPGWMDQKRGPGQMGIPWEGAEAICGIWKLL